MSWDDKNPYYKPAAFDLEILETHERPDMSYEFDMFVIWRPKDADKKSDIVYWADDSGCSCPCPFESFTSIDKLSVGKLEEAYRDLGAWKARWMFRGY